MTAVNTYLLYLAGLLRPLGIHYGKLEADPVVNQAGSRDAAGFSKQEDSGIYVLHTVRFIDQHSEVFDRLGTGTARHLTELLLASISGDNPEGRSLALADRLAAGGPIATGAGPIKPLGSVYGRLLSRSHSDSFHRPVVLEADKRIFPEIGAWSSGAPGDVTFTGFIKEFKALSRAAPEMFCECLTALIRKYFSFNWAGWTHLPEVSLYERCRLTSAFAAVLAGSDEPVDSGHFLLVGGDLSGIQDYLYDIVGREAYKNLKGRSFYLHLLANGVLERLLQRLGLLSVHVIYVSGGGFYVMAPDSNRNRETVDAFRQELERIMFRKHRNNLYFSLAAVPFTGADILDQKTADAWTDLAHELADLKRRRFATQLQQDYSVFFEPFEAGGLQQRDLITGDEIEGNAVRYLDDDRDKPVSPDTYQQIELGRLLRNDIGTWISSDDTSRAIMAHRTFRIEDGLPTSIFPLDEQLGGIIPTLPEKSRVRLINSSEFPEALLSGYPGSFDVEFYGGSEIPRNRDGSPKTFEDLSGLEGREAGLLAHGRR
jgi:CRISPR-associated protein Csm1